MLPLDLQRIRANARAATTEDLLDRVTVYRSGMEPEALEIIEEELGERGVDMDQIADHARERAASIIEQADGTALPCSFCQRPAVAKGWSSYKILKLVPIFPRAVAWCAEHMPKQPDDGEPPIDE